MKLGGKIALVTGASRGIGAAIARAFAAEGAAIVVNYRTAKDSAMRVVAEIEENGGKAIALRADVADPDAVYEMVSICVNRLT